MDIITGITSYLSQIFSSREIGAECTSHFHSGFSYIFFKDKVKYPEYDIVNRARKDLLSNGRRPVPVNTHGACASGTGTVKLSSVIKRSSVSEKQGRLLFRIARWFKPARIFELGTSAGISTMYMALGNPSADVVTVEGNPALAEIASSSFKEHHLENIKLLNCTFREALSGFVTGNLPTLVFIDGDHSYEATREYFDFFSNCLTGTYVIIIHDIYWSGGMKKAWKEISASRENCCAVDLFFMGIVYNF